MGAKMDAATCDIEAYDTLKKGVKDLLQAKADVVAKHRAFKEVGRGLRAARRLDECFTLPCISY